MTDMPAYEYEFEGFVESGNQIGRKMGIPTVNIPVSNMSSCDDLPQFGVYATTVVVPEYGLLRGIANIGCKPTVVKTNSDGEIVDNPVGIEVFIFDFEGDLYNKNIKVYFHKFIRCEKKFDDFEQLKAQIEKDIVITKDILNTIYETT